ncbi:hypothetical protein KCP78_01040 [Salmonella enterica subsp. enterica]|nr:hypothetical protein KCP78_01040 [Salmonella enterica subsp. enterica]
MSSTRIGAGQTHDTEDEAQFKEGRAAAGSGAVPLNAAALEDPEPVLSASEPVAGVLDNVSI